MEHWINEARRILSATPAGALPYSRLLLELRRAGGAVREGDTRLLVAMEEREDLFRVVREPPGPWFPDSPGGDTNRRDPWILLKAPLFREPDETDGLKRILTETVQAWGQVLDLESASEVARWLRATREGAHLLATLREGRRQTA